MLAITSCQEDAVDIEALRAQSNTNKLSTAAPTIAYIYDYDDFVSDNFTPCNDASMGQYLVISGENLQGVTSLEFHGIAISTADYYAQWDKIVMSVPSKLPESGAAESVVCTTELGSDEYAIALIIPDIVISDVSNEFELPGEEVTINGSYLTLCGFDSGNSKIYLEKSSATYKEQLSVSNITDTSVTVTIPETAPDNAYFTFEITGEDSTPKIHYRPTDLLLYGDEDLATSGFTAAVEGMTISYTAGDNEGDPENLIPDGLDGESGPINYYRVTGSRTSTSWGKLIGIDEDTIPFTAYYDTPITNPEDYYLVFEVNTESGKSINKNLYKVRFPNGAPFLIFDSEIDTDGEWVTCRVDLTGLTGTVLSNATSSNSSFEFAVNYSTTNADHSFANFRIEPKSPQ